MSPITTTPAAPAAPPAPAAPSISTQLAASVVATGQLQAQLEASLDTVLASGPGNASSLDLLKMQQDTAALSLGTELTAAQIAAHRDIAKGIVAKL